MKLAAAAIGAVAVLSTAAYVIVRTRCVSSESPRPPGHLAQFRDRAPESGIRFQLGHEGRSPLTILDSLGQGAAFLDFDQDQRLDLLLVSDRTAALYRNTGAGKFEDVTARMNAGARGYWHGVAVGDIDNDGDPDVCLVGYRSLALLRNDRLRFVDVTRDCGVTAPGWGSSAGFADLDRDGQLDLVVGDYLEFGPDSVQHCTVGDVKTACGPKIYSARFPRVYQNLGGRFVDVTRKWGFADAHGKTLGVAFGDFNADGWLDVAMANDEMPQDLYLRAPGRATRFQNVGVERAFAYLASGRVQSGMGIDAADFDGNGTEDVVVTNFQNEPAGLYSNEGSFFTEISGAGGVAAPTYPYVGWGVRFLDAENDGDLDLLMANGHIQDNVALTSAASTYAQPLLLLSNEGQGTFRSLGAGAGPPFSRPIVGRGLAVGDYDDDGKVDALVVDIEGRPLLLHNESAVTNHWLGLELVTGDPPRPAIGARVSCSVGGAAVSRRVNVAGGIFSSHDPRVLIGLGPVTQVEEVIVDWPSGKRERFKAPAADRYLRVHEGVPGMRESASR